MKIELIASTGGLRDVNGMIGFGLRCARVCYTSKDWDQIQKEQVNEQLLERLIRSGHHSVFEHVSLTFRFDELPKALAMIFNNEKQYASSEKSARYTIMSGMEPHQKELYEKWMARLIPEIDEICPRIKDEGAREEAIKKLAQENARYMTSVFTPIRMVHTVNLRQLNFLQQQFEIFVREHRSSGDDFKDKLAEQMQYFLEQTRDLRVCGLDNQTNRELSLFSAGRLTPATTEGEVYSRVYLLSFAGLAQAHRHRTISYNILGGTERGAKSGFFVPPIVRVKGLEEEWIKDLRQVAETDFPQAQLLEVYERGRIEDFRSKALLRLCGHAQLEIMRTTLETAREYRTYQNAYGEDALNPKCLQGIKCPSPCVWSGRRALERIV